MQLQEVAAIRRMKAFFYCRMLSLGLTLILVIFHMVRSQIYAVHHATHYLKLPLSLSFHLPQQNIATVQSQTPTCAPMQEDCSKSIASVEVR